MGSATRGALTALRDTLAQQGGAADLGVAEELFSIARLLAHRRSFVTPWPIRPPIQRRRRL